METYTYKARDEKGNLITGEMIVETKNQIYDSLSEKHFFPISVEEKKDRIAFEFFERIFRKPSSKDLISFTRQFYSLFKAGVNLNKLFSIEIKQCTNPLMKRTLAAIQFDIQQGGSLEAAFHKHPRIFNRVYTSMLAIGEQGGILDKTLKDLISILEKDHKISKKVISATLYPKIVMGVVCAVIVLALTYIIPIFKDFYSSYGKSLPLPTLILMGMSDFLRSYWYIFLGMGAAGIIAFKRFIATSKGRYLFDQFTFKIPVFGNLELLVANARFGHLLSSLYKSGLPMLKTLDIVASSIGNSAYERSMKAIEQKIQAGSSIAHAMEEEPYFTPIMIEATTVGEETGNLDEMLENVANFYDDEVDYILENLSTILEPFLLVFIFGIIGLLALAIYLPIINLARTVLPGG
jgi:type IV pilus assembly protein PilC